MLTERKTIKFSELKRLTFCNSKKLPKQVEFTGKVRGKIVRRVMEYVGIGWIDIQDCNIDDPVLVVDG